MSNSRSNEQIVAEALRKMVPSGDATTKRESQAVNIVRDLGAAGRLAGEQLSGNTGQFTEAMVLAAAKALEKLPLNLITRVEALDAARAALVAAQGAAPQAESADYLSPHTHPRRAELVAVIDDEAGSYDPITTGCGYHESLKLADGSDMAERIADKVIYAGLSPVLPSSTESPVEPFKTWFACWWKNEPNAIAESNAQSAFYAGWDARGLPSSGVDEDALAEVIEAEIDKLRHETRLYPDIYKAEVARAVAEWLKEHGVGKY